MLPLPWKAPSWALSQRDPRSDLHRHGRVSPDLGQTQRLPCRTRPSVSFCNRLTLPRGSTPGTADQPVSDEQSGEQTVNEEEAEAPNSEADKTQTQDTPHCTMQSASSPGPGAVGADSEPLLEGERKGTGGAGSTGAPRLLRGLRCPRLGPLSHGSQLSPTGKGKAGSSRLAGLLAQGKAGQLCSKGGSSKGNPRPERSPSWTIESS